MKSQILEKLQTELKKKVDGEPRVVYILSRIRKVIESERNQDKYPVLNLYCNWSLHTEITRTNHKKIRAILDEFINKPEERSKFAHHIQFFSEINTFLQKHWLPELDEQKITDFRFYLTRILSDTPVEVIIGTKYKFVFSEPLNKVDSGNYVITTLD